MKTKTLLLIMTIMSLATFISCEKDISTTLDNDPNTTIVCGTKNPMIDLPWLVEKMKTYRSYSPDGMGVCLFEYKGNSVIEIQSFLSSSSNIHQYFCDGTKLDFKSTSENVKLYKDYVLNRKEIRFLYGKKVSTFYPKF